MGVIVAFGRKKAFLRDGHWRSADTALEQQLNLVTRAWIEETGGPSLSSTDPEGEAAREIARRAGGRLILQIPVKGRRAHSVWFAQRQYRLAFH